MGMILETLGTGLVMPVLELITSGDAAATFPQLQPLLKVSGYPSQAQIVITSMSILVVVFAVKVGFIAYLASRQARFAFGLQAQLSERLFSGYLHQPWTFHLRRNSAQLIRNATTEVGLFTNLVISIQLVLTEGLVAFGIATLLIVVEPVGAFAVIFCLTIAALTFYRLTRGRLLRWGKARQHHEGFRIQHLQQGLGGAKDAKILGREAEFLKQYHLHNFESSEAQRRLATVQQLPRLWLELLAVVGLASLVFIMIANGRPLDKLLPTVGLFVVAAFRLMPSVSRVMTSAQVVRYNHPVVKMLCDEIGTLSAGVVVPTMTSPGRFQSEIQLDCVSFRYENAENEALRDISLRIPFGESVGIIGGSGAGKSTLVDIILGLLTPSNGSVLVDGRDIRTQMRGWQDQIGYVPQSIFLTDDTLRRNVAFGLPEESIDNKAVERAIQAAQLEQFVASLPEALDTVVGERGIRLSGGQRQRIGIARALYHNPTVLVLDEATSSLDTLSERGVMNAVNALRGEKTILIVAHRLSTVANCDRLFRFEQGSLAATGSFDLVVGDQVSGNRR